MRSPGTPTQRTWHTPCGFIESSESMVPPGLLLYMCGHVRVESRKLTQLAENMTQEHKNDNLNDCGHLRWLESKTYEFLDDANMSVAVTDERKQEVRRQDPSTTLIELHRLLYNVASYLQVIRTDELEATTSNEHSNTLLSRLSIEHSNTLLSRSNDILQSVYVTICYTRLALDSLGRRPTIMGPVSPSAVFNQTEIPDTGNDARAYIVFNATVAVGRFVTSMVTEVMGLM